WPGFSVRSCGLLLLRRQAFRNPARRPFRGTLGNAGDRTAALFWVGGGPGLAGPQLGVSRVVHFFDPASAGAGVPDLLLAFFAALLKDDRSLRAFAAPDLVADLERLAVPLGGEQGVQAVGIDPHHLQFGRVEVLDERLEVLVIFRPGAALVILIGGV